MIHETLKTFKKKIQALSAPSRAKRDHLEDALSAFSEREDQRTLFFMRLAHRVAKRIHR